MTTLFISDLHLSEDRQDLVEIFLKFLRDKATQAEALYILGDFFEVWIGDDIETPVTQAVAKALNAVSQKGCHIYFMHGNRDFLIGKKYLRQCGAQLLKDIKIIDLYGVKTILMHGDTLCTQDISYLKFRKKVRNPLTQFLFLRKSLNIRKDIAQQLRERSKLHMQEKSAEIMDATANEIPRILDKYQAELLIHGHTHRPGIELIKMKDHFAKRIVLSDWETRGHVLVCERDGVQKLVYFE